MLYTCIYVYIYIYRYGRSKAHPSLAADDECGHHLAGLGALGFVALGFVALVFVVAIRALVRSSTCACACVARCAYQGTLYRMHSTKGHSTEHVHALSRPTLLALTLTLTLTHPHPHRSPITDHRSPITDHPHPHPSHPHTHTPSHPHPSTPHPSSTPHPHPIPGTLYPAPRWAGSSLVCSSLSLGVAAGPSALDGREEGEVTLRSRAI